MANGLDFDEDSAIQSAFASPVTTADEVIASRVGFGARRSAFGDLVGRLAAGLRTAAERLPRVPTELPGLGTLRAGRAAVESFLAPVESLGRQFARIMDPYTMAQAEAREAAGPDPLAQQRAMMAVREAAARRGARRAAEPPTANPAPQAPSQAEAAPVAPRRAVPRPAAPALPKTGFRDLDVGFQNVVNFLAQAGQARAEERLQRAEVEAAGRAAAAESAALARLARPVVEFETDPVTGEVRGVAVFNPLTGQGARRPVQTQVPPEIRSQALAEAERKYREGASLEEINKSLAKFGLTFTPPAQR